MADDIFTKDLLTYDPLSETTRKERTSLLGLSMLGVALVKVPLVPEKFSALGVDFSHVNQTAFVKLYAVVVVYYLVAFSLYAFTDYVGWRRSEVIQLNEYSRQQRERPPVVLPAPDGTFHPALEPHMQPLSDQRGRLNPVYKGVAGYWFGYRAARVRAAFEFVLPIMFGAYALWVLFAYVPTKP